MNRKGPRTCWAQQSESYFFCCRTFRDFNVLYDSPRGRQSTQVFWSIEPFFWGEHLSSSRAPLLSPKELWDPTLYTLPPLFSYDMPVVHVLGIYPRATLYLIPTPNRPSFCSGLSTLPPSPEALDLGPVTQFPSEM